MKTHIDAPASEIYWRYTKPESDLGAKRQLLTVGGIAVHGVWAGEPGEYFLGWSPMLKRDKLAERALLNAHSKTTISPQTPPNK